MHRFFSLAAVLLFFATVAYGGAFTNGNFLILYGNGALGPASYDSVDIVSTFIEEFTTSGASVQVINISSSCATELNIWSGAPKLSTDGSLIAIGCRIPNGVTTNILGLKCAAATVDHNGVIDTSTKFNAAKKIFRVTLDGNHVYVSGNDLIGYTPYKSADSLVSLVPTIRHIQDAYAHQGYLYVTNFQWNTWGMARLGSPLPVTTSPQTTTTVINSTFISYPTSLSFFEVGMNEYLYVSEESEYQIRKLQKVNGNWIELYRTNTGLGTTIITSQIFYENGDGTNTIVFATHDKLYTTIDNGASFSAITQLVARTGNVIKGIAWVPSAPVVPVATPVAVPVATPVAVPVPVPVASPVAVPVAAPLADPPVVEPMSDAPVASEPVSTPTPSGQVEPSGSNAPVSDEPTSKVPVKTDSQTSGAPSKSSIVLAALGAALVLLTVAL